MRSIKKAMQVTQQVRLNTFRWTHSRAYTCSHRGKPSWLVSYLSTTHRTTALRISLPSTNYTGRAARAVCYHVAPAWWSPLVSPPEKKRMLGFERSNATPRFCEISPDSSSRQRPRPCIALAASSCFAHI
ncbi:hypothetical protein AcW1_008328 [Taiwanofungus camphoratus]|nr:hypothetical protein AcW1_008328 [Antrodia cinnamomea]